MGHKGLVAMHFLTGRQGCRERDVSRLGIGENSLFEVDIDLLVNSETRIPIIILALVLFVLLSVSLEN